MNKMKMDSYRAAMIAEQEWELAGVGPEDEEAILEGWQYLIDTGLAWRLQGRVGRQAQYLIAQGLCQSAETTSQINLEQNGPRGLCHA